MGEKKRDTVDTKNIQEERRETLNSVHVEVRLLSDLRQLESGELQYLGHPDPSLLQTGMF